MEKLVKITSLLDGLSDNEHNKFFNVLMSQFPQRSIVKSFVVNLLKHSIKETDCSYYNQLNKILSKIISLRNKNKLNKIKSIQQSSTTKFITDLPSSMISECASYLPLRVLITNAL